MVKPKGVWLQTTELAEVKEAQVVKSSAVAKQPLPQTRGNSKKPLLIGALSVCCCVLLLLVGLHIYPALSAGTPENPAAAALAEPAGLNILEPSYGVIVAADGQNYVTACRGQTVAEALHQVGVDISARDEVSQPLDMLIESDCIITVSRLYDRVETETEKIAPTYSRVDDATLSAGVTKVLTEGEPGLRENTVNVSYRDGEEVDRLVVASRVIKEPGVTTIAQGIGLASRAGDSSAAIAMAEDGSGPATISVNGKELSYSRKLTMESTAYTWTGNTTATGTWPAKGTVAVDPRVIPLGSQLYVEGYGLATATDTGGAIKGSIIDVYFSSYEECIQWGRKHGLTVYILE